MIICQLSKIYGFLLGCLSFLSVVVQAENHQLKRR
jgi:hypothetical protein